jgi:hypothetical protein
VTPPLGDDGPADDQRSAGPGPSPDAAGALRSPSVRLVWSVVVLLLVIGLGAWGTTCTGERPQPTGDTVPTAETTLAPSSETPAG